MVKINPSFVVIFFTLLTATISGQDTDVSPIVLHYAAIQYDTIRCSSMSFTRALH